MAKWAFLWITDLHFASPNSNYIDDPRELDLPGDQRFRDTIVRSLHTILDLDFRKIANGETQESLSFVAIGGDITTRGESHGFKQFSRDTFPKLSRLVSTPDAICIVPGNHDVVWGINPYSADYFTRKFAPFVSVLHKGVSSCLFPKGQLNFGQVDQDDQLYFDPPDRGPIYCSDEKRVIVLNINSSIRCGELNYKLASDLLPHLASTNDKAAKNPATISREDFDPKIRPYLVRDVAHVTQSQISSLGESLEKEKTRIGDDWENYLRVALIHHHLAPFPNQSLEHKSYEATVDASAVLQFLTNHDFDLVLTGHKHQPHVSSYRFNGKEIVIIGGPTVGGAASNECFRGIQFVDVISNHHGRRIYVTDLPCGALPDKTDLEQKLELRQQKKADATLSANTARIAARKSGFRYRDVVSITSINEDGDGHRVVECEDLIITKQCNRMESHPIELPPTSGYLDMLRAEAMKTGHEVFVHKGISGGHGSKSATVELGFDPVLRKEGQEDTFSYKYEWFAVNGFALDKLQFERKYGTLQTFLRNIEFTHFIPVDPIERLTVIVQFPKDMKLSHPPTLRIMRVDKNKQDTRTWDIDEEERDHLTDIRALRFFKSLNISALRLRAPKPGLSYGIQWKMPEAPNFCLPTSTLATLIEKLNNVPNDAIKRSYRVLNLSRKKLLVGWQKALDVTFMLFNPAEHGGFLKTIAAGVSSGASNTEDDMYKLSVESKVVLEYGDGIAGRAFKANAIRIYQDTNTSGPKITDHDRKYEPKFYKPIPGTISHKHLIAFPVHLPVSEADFAKNPNIYKSCEPYGVFNLGSEMPDCPISQYLLPERVPVLLTFQHSINKILAQSNV